MAQHPLALDAYARSQFSSQTKVSNFSVFLLDGEPSRVVTYTVQDDQGGMQTITNTATFGQGYTVMLPEAGIRQVTVTSNGGANWDFVIDNIRFSPD